MRLLSWTVISALALCGCTKLSSSSTTSVPSNNGDTAFHTLADDYINGFLGWRPLTGTTLGLHEYDGRITDFSRASLDKELARLNASQQRLSDLDTNALSGRALYDYRILRGAI